eukprot:scaffold2868_cov348-Pavlova_lutheri.AAC.21
MEACTWTRGDGLVVLLATDFHPGSKLHAFRRKPGRENIPSGVGNAASSRPRSWSRRSTACHTEWCVSGQEMQVRRRRFRTPPLGERTPSCRNAHLGRRWAGFTPPSRWVAGIGCGSPGSPDRSTGAVRSRPEV